MSRIHGIQYLRALAALSVVILHAGDRSGFDFSIGGAGVDVFFVISGFIMWTIGTERTPAPGNFLLRRFVRIVPLYWAVTLGLFAIVSVAPQLMPRLVADPERLVLSLLFVPHRDPGGNLMPLLAQGWTLNYEMFFYMVFAAVMLLPPRLWLAALTLVLAGLAAASLLLRPSGPVLAVYTDPLLLEFLAGVWIGWLWRAGRLPGTAAGLALAAGGLAALLSLHLLGLGVGDWRVVLWGIPGAAIVTGTLSLEAGGLVPRWAWLERLGDASYSIYLLHGPLVGLLWRLTGQASQAFHLLVTLAVSSALALLVWRYFERPFATAVRFAPAAREGA